MQENISPAAPLSSELHLFIVWSSALLKAEQILADLSRRVEILDVYNMNWEVARFSQNLSRFYGKKLPAGCQKEQVCGTGPFLLIVVRDNNPQYESRYTSRGRNEIVNANIFDAKQLYRVWTGGYSRVHGTDSEKETEHDLALLLNSSIQKFLKTHPAPWDGGIREIRQNIAGADGWASVEELFEILNSTINYVVLRNFECLPEQYVMEKHGDIDLLTDNLADMKFITQGKPVFAEQYRVLHQVKIGGQQVLFDFRHVGDNYYCEQWQKDILQNRILSPKGFFRPSDEDHFYSLLYHAAVQKPAIAPDYIQRLVRLALDQSISGIDAQVLGSPSQVRKILADFLQKHDYNFTIPVDHSVHRNRYYLEDASAKLEDAFAGSQSTGEAIRRILTDIKDVSSDAQAQTAPEFYKHWILRYHFSWRRHLLLKCLPLAGRSRILELGAESGILTRYLGEQFPLVDAVEADPEMAQAAALRCKDLASVNIHKESVSDFKGTKPYDLAVVVSDLITMGQKKSAGDLHVRLTKAAQCLGEKGVLVLAVENKLGFKFFDNRKEEYTGKPFAGIYGYPDEDPAPGFSKVEIREMLQELGFGAFRFAYPFPDHKQPRIFLTDEALSHKKRAIGYWAASEPFEDYLEHTLPEMNQLLACGELSRAGLLGEMANSFLILAARTEEDLPVFPWQVLAYSHEMRNKAYRTVNRIASGDRDLSVHKLGTPFAGRSFTFAPEATYPLYEGHTLAAMMARQIQTGDFNFFMQLVHKYAHFLRTTFATDLAEMPTVIAESDTNLEGRALDAIPRNIIVTGSGVEAFDLEWIANMKLPLSYVLFRGLQSLRQIVLSTEFVEKLKLRRFGEIKSFDEALMHVINQTHLFQLQRRHLMLFDQFERTFLNFAVRSSENFRSLLEYLQITFECLGRKDLEGARKVFAEMRKNHPQEPEVLALSRSLG